VNFRTLHAPWNRSDSKSSAHFTPQNSDSGSGTGLKEIIDPVPPHAQGVLDNKLISPGAEAFKAMDLVNDMRESVGEEPDAMFIAGGTPPALRGTMIAGRDVEMATSSLVPF